MKKAIPFGEGTVRLERTECKSVHTEYGKYHLMLACPALSEDEVVYPAECVSLVCNREDLVRLKVMMDDILEN